MMSSKNQKLTDTKLREQLLNNLGYLRIPQAVKDRFGTPTRYPNPDYRIGKDDEESFELIFVFPKEQMEEKK